MIPIDEIIFTCVQCAHCSTAIPLGWEVVVVEPVIVQVTSAGVDLTTLWVDSAGNPAIPPAIFSSVDPDEIVEGLGVLEDEEYEQLMETADVPFNCWRDITDLLGEMSPDTEPSDELLRCDYCSEPLEPGEGAMRVTLCTVERSRRQPSDGSRVASVRMVPSSAEEPAVMCLKCAYLISKEIIGVDEMTGQRLIWPML